MDCIITIWLTQQYCVATPQRMMVGQGKGLNNLAVVDVA